MLCCCDRYCQGICPGTESPLRELAPRPSAKEKGRSFLPAQRLQLPSLGSCKDRDRAQLLSYAQGIGQLPSPGQRSESKNLCLMSCWHKNSVSSWGLSRGRSNPLTEIQKGIGPKVAPSCLCKGCCSSSYASLTKLSEGLFLLVHRLVKISWKCLHKLVDQTIKVCLSYIYEHMHRNTCTKNAISNSCLVLHCASFSPQCTMTKLIE